MIPNASSEKVRAAFEQLSEFSALEKNIRGDDVAQLVSKVFSACGYNVLETGFVGGFQRADCFIRGAIDGKEQTIAIEMKSGRRPAGVESVQQAFALKKQSLMFDRSMIISLGGFSSEAQKEADTLGLGEIDLLDMAALRNWLNKQILPRKDCETHDQIIRRSMQELVNLVAQDSDALRSLRWWELEGVLREAFDSMGFEAKPTRPAKDGGFDLELTLNEGERRRVFLVEVKHWTDSRPGAQHLKKLIKVTLSQGAEGGLFLSSSGFTKTIFNGITEISAPVHLGSRDKIVSLCRTYYRLKNQIWREDLDLYQQLIDGTWGIKKTFNG